MPKVNLVVTPSDPEAIDVIVGVLEEEVPTRVEGGSVIGVFDFAGEVTEEDLRGLEEAYSDVFANFDLGPVTVDARVVKKKGGANLKPWLIIGGAAAAVGLAVFFGMRRREQQQEVQGMDDLRALESSCSSCQAARAA